MCGIVGVVSTAPVNQLIYDALLLLQHRGQDAAGIVTQEGRKFFMHKAKGMVRDVFRTRNMRALPGSIGLGQVRYPTAGSAASEEEAQPFYVNAPFGIVMVHNGNLTNAKQLRRELAETDHRHTNTESDSEVLLNVLAHELARASSGASLTTDDVFAAVRAVHLRIKGSYAVVALIAGYVLLKLVHPENGYWILLTIVFVCRPNFGATRLRLVHRIAGTLLGLGVTWALMQLFPGTTLQLLLALAAALLFFVTRNERYVIATAAITLMALLCFNLLGDNGLVMIWPRLLDTLLGGAIAVVASLLILPDWQGRRLHRVMAQVAATCTRYLDEVLGQYRSGMRDDLPYRIARRDMHNADVALSVALANMLREPGYARGNLDAGFRFLALSNTLLGYLSALGAHRAQAAAVEGDPLIEQGHRQLRQSLAQLADALEQRQPATPQEDEVALADALEQLPDDIDDKPRLVRTQLALMLRLLPKLRAAAAEALKAPLPSG